MTALNTITVELPYHIQEAIIDKLDNKTKAKCRIINTHFNNYIGDITPKHIQHQSTFLNVLRNLVDNPKCAFFNLAINSLNFRMIVSDENSFELYVYIIKKGLGAKTVTRNYKKNKCVINFQDNFKKRTIYGSHNIPSYQLFEDIFSNIRSVSCASGKQTPSSFLQWKNKINRHHQNNHHQNNRME